MFYFYKMNVLPLKYGILCVQRKQSCILLYVLIKDSLLFFWSSLELLFLMF